MVFSGVSQLRRPGQPELDSVNLVVAQVTRVEASCNQNGWNLFSKRLPHALSCNTASIAAPVLAVSDLPLPFSVPAAGIAKPACSLCFL